MTPQGTGVYVTARFVGDIYSAWMLKVATGENPYVNMEKVVRSCLSYEFTPRKLFNDGDGTSDYVDAFRYMDIAYISAYLFGDTTLLAQGDFLLGSKTLSCGIHRKSYMGINNPIYMALSGLCDIQPNSNRYDGLDLINYNGHPFGQYLVHSAWDDPAAASIFMRIKERTNANHEHGDAGTFEIYYKGMLTSDGGIYDNSSAHGLNYHKATISHNGLIIYDPSKVSTEGEWYSGGQRVGLKASTDLDKWLADDNMKTGTVTAHQHGYLNGDKSQPLYAYIAGDIAAAYDSSTVSYVGRRMLTVFTGDEEFPMAFFVFDDISSVAGCTRKFLLQISSKNAPSINTKKQTVTTENGDGKLVLTCLTEGNIIINGVGGRNEGGYSASLSKNYLINGKQCLPSSNSSDDGHWGRVEIVYASQSTDVTFMNVLYVTDKGNTNAASVVSITNASGLEGGVFDGKIAGLFATSRTGATSTLSCTTAGEGNLSYYVSGVKAGEWVVTVDGKDYGSYTATEEGGLLTFTAPAGSITLTKVDSAEIMREDFTAVNLNRPTEVVTINNIRYSSSNTACDYYTVSDSEDAYLRIDTTNGAQMQAMANLYEALDGETSVSYTVTLATVQDVNPLTISFRLRDGKSGNNYRQIFSVDADGNVKLGGETTVAQLTTKLTEFKFVVDFKTGKLHYYAEDGSVTSLDFEPRSDAATTLEWLSYITTRYFDCSAASASGSIKIGEIGVYRGNIFD